MQVSRITLPSACDVRAWLRETRNGLETHDRGGRMDESKGEFCEGRYKLYLSVLLCFVARLKSCNKKSSVFHVSFRTSNKYSLRDLSENSCGWLLISPANSLTEC